MKTGSRKPTKAEVAEMRRVEEARAIRAMDCRGCPYAGRVGATAMLTWDEMCERYGDDEGAPQ